jgi:alpha-glucoside transport system permease protein
MTATTVAEARSTNRTFAQQVTRFIQGSPIHIVLGLIGLVWLLPSVGLLITSFRPSSDMRASGWWTVLTNPNFTLDNYQRVLEGEGIGGAFLNSVYITVPSTLIPLVIASLAAFALAWIKFPLRDTTFLVIIGLMMVPVQIGFIPLVQGLRPTGLLTNFGAIWLTHAAYALPFGIFLLRNFFITLPKDLIEAARIDGASNLGIFRTIVVPLSVPAIASYGIFQFLWVWNDLLMALVYVQRNAAQPMTVKITQLLGTYASEWSLLAAASTSTSSRSRRSRSYRGTATWSTTRATWRGSWTCGSASPPCARSRSSRTVRCVVSAASAMRSCRANRFAPPARFRCPPPRPTRWWSPSASITRWPGSASPTRRPTSGSRAACCLPRSTG